MVVAATLKVVAVVALLVEVVASTTTDQVEAVAFQLAMVPVFLCELEPRVANDRCDSHVEVDMVKVGERATTAPGEVGGTEKMDAGRHPGMEMAHDLVRVCYNKNHRHKGSFWNGMYFV